MTNNIVYAIYEDDHGLIGVADSKKAAFSFLVNRGWLAADTLCSYSADDNFRPLAEICKEEGITEENFLDWAVWRLEQTYFWDVSGFSIYTIEFYTEKTI